MNGLIELDRRITRGFRNRENYRLRLLSAEVDLTDDPTHSSVKIPFSSVDGSAPRSQFVHHFRAKLPMLIG